MKNVKLTVLTTLAALLVGFTLTCRADDQKTDKPKPYPLDTCLVCDMKLDSMGKPFTFVYNGQEIKVCDKSEQADFNKDPKKFLKKLAAAEAKLEKTDSKPNA
jgi:YHS domain-containing protein